MGQPGFLRSLKEYYELLKPWQPEASGFISLLEWHGFAESELSKDDSQGLGAMGSGYGAYLIKPA
jgi:hypothetical protein